jgi:glyoxylase-like metal-dependent hydrolase (beta-lactamase superfamily II)
MIVQRKKFACSIFVLFFITAFLSLGYAQDFEKVQIQVEKARDGVYMLVGSGGNIGVSAGADGVVMIDDQYAPLTNKIKTAIATISDKSVRFVINTHWHQDHTGGNENLGEAGAVIVAHENVRKRMSTEQFMKVFDRKVPPSPKGALPVITFTQDVKFHLNGDEIHVFHVDHAHTDGDAIIYFSKSNVIHMGDTCFAGRYPFIDLSSGGSVDGVIAAVDLVLSMVDDETKVIPGHGPLTDKKGLKTFRDMLTSIKDRIGEQIAAGMSLEKVLASKPTQDFDAVWGTGFLKPDKFIKILYKDLSE